MGDALRRALTWLLLDRRAGARGLSVGLAFVAVQAAALATAAAYDNVFWLGGRGLGLLEHPGIPAILIADFGLLALLGSAARRFLRLPSRVPVHRQNSSRRVLRRALSRGRATLLLRGRARAFYFLAAGVGVLLWLQNAIQTRDPVTFYGRDVFDSSAHAASYLVVRAVLFGSWVVLYPYAAVAFLGISGNVYRAMAILERNRRLAYRHFHPDKCGGYSTIGDISFATIMSILLLYGSLAVVIMTHHKLNVLQVSGFVILSTALVLTSFFIIWPVSRFMWKQRRLDRQSGYQRLAHRPDEFAVLRLLWVSTVASYSPYARYQALLINGARLMPIVIAGVRLMRVI